jgi:hypothetical protein
MAHWELSINVIAETLQATYSEVGDSSEIAREPKALYFLRYLVLGTPCAQSLPAHAARSR